MSNKNTAVRRVCFTLHDYGLIDLKRILGIKYKYIVIGYERCPTTGREHLQGFINLQAPTKFNTVKAQIGVKSHIERTRGTDEQNRTYCVKSGEFIEDGVLSQQGRRSDLEMAAREVVASRGNLKSTAEQFPCVFIRYHQGLRAYSKIMFRPTPRCFKTSLHVYVGSPGAGKSRGAREAALAICLHLQSSRTQGAPRQPENQHPAAEQTTDGDFQARDGLAPPRADSGEPSTDTQDAAECIFYKQRGEWWDGYCQQPVVIIDDFYGWLKYDELLKIADRYPYRVPVKGSYEEFNSSTIFITSNVQVDKWYKFDGYDPRALYRRITEYKHFDRLDDGTFCNHDIIDYEINY